MKYETKAEKKKQGFTLMELLVVIGIIALLVGILAPGMRKFTIHAKKLKQRAQLHAIETGLEFFRSDFNNYPDSAMISLTSTSGKVVCGAQMLAEALIGRDGHGYEPSQNIVWVEPGEQPDLSTGITDLYDYSKQTSKNRRKPLYINLRDTGYYTMKELYGDPDYTNLGGIVYSDENNGAEAPVLTDIFGKKKITNAAGETVKAGMPILYYKADTSSKLFKKDASNDNITTVSTWIYNFYDNAAITGDAGVAVPGVIDDPDNPKKQHKLDKNKFYETITNPNISYDWPFNPKTFILISAGWDGIYGTKDDVSNFKF